MFLNILTKDDFEEFKMEIQELIKQNFENKSDKKFLRSADVREMLNISATTLQNMRLNGDIPHTKIGTTYFYDYDEILKILSQNSSENLS